MRLVGAVLVLLIQGQTLPPPYPRDGTTKLLENGRVIVWDVSWLQQAYPVHRHVYDYSGVYYTNGDRVIVSERGARSRTTSVAWDTFFFRRGVTHSEEGASDDAAARRVSGIQGTGPARGGGYGREHAGVPRYGGQECPRE